MSGGVDSTVAAFLLKEHGCSVTGVTMQIWDGAESVHDTGRSGCYGPGEAEEIKSARQIADRIGIPHVVVPLAPEYRSSVIEYFRAEYMAGRTPNPCVMCNRRIKFGALLDKLAGMGIEFDLFATGHYARTMRGIAGERNLLLKGVDPLKDQSYFLSHLSQTQLGRVVFPLGGTTKAEVKRFAAGLGWFDLTAVQESQDFIDGGNYSALFSDREMTPGRILDTKGRVLGTHRGLVHYTIGQRKNLGLGGGSDRPLYVLGMDGCSNTITVGEHGELFSRELRASSLNWIALESSPVSPLKVSARIRQQHREAPALLTMLDDHTAEVIFDAPQMSITPGQAVVFYDGDSVIGGGTIDTPPGRSTSA